MAHNHFVKPRVKCPTCGGLATAYEESPDRAAPTGWIRYEAIRPKAKIKKKKRNA